MPRKKKIKSGYQKDKKPKVRKKNRSWLSKLIVAPYRKVSLMEKIIKFFIFIALRIAIKPSRWKEPKKNYEIIDRTYKRFMSNDFIYIPTSIAFYIIIAFMPILSIISLVYYIPPIEIFLENNRNKENLDLLQQVIGGFIPGSTELIESLKEIPDSGLAPGALGTIIVSLIISTWISSNGFAKIVYTESYIFNHKFVGGYWMNRLKGFFMVLCFVFFLLLILFANILFVNWLNHHHEKGILRRLWTYLWLISTLSVGVFVGIISLFKFSPRFFIKVRHTIPGAIVTTVPTVGFLVFFGIITSFWHYDRYGIVGSIMYIGISSLIIVDFIYVGLITNNSYYKTFVGDKMKKKWTISRK